MNVTHYYTQVAKQMKDTKSQWLQGQKFMPYSSNTSSVEAIASRLITTQKTPQQTVMANQPSLNSSLI
jgi:hypothetical protein